MLSDNNKKTFRAMIETRASAADWAGRTLLVDGETRWTYAQYRDQALRTGEFLLRRTRALAPFKRGHVAVLSENRKEYLALLGGCAYAGLTFFAVNTLLRGSALAQTLNQSRATVLIVGEEFAAEARAVLDQLQWIDEGALFVIGDGDEGGAYRHLLQGTTSEPSAALAELARIEVEPADPLVVIYTSGTTGVPKGVLVSQGRLCQSAEITASNIPIDRDDVSYCCMPLCHSNALLANFMPLFGVGGKVVLRRRFSASRFIDDILHHGITYWSYVGEPVHYILNHVESRFAGDEQRIATELSRHPDNKLRFTLGNGASAVDIERFIKWFGLTHMYEAYGQTESVIMAFRTADTPRGSVGEMHDANVRILAEDGGECPPAQVDEHGRIANYREAVGELCRIDTDATLFLGYFDNPEATAKKCRDGIYYSGDMAHIALHGGKRYLYFDGRTDNWIRKDGENFAAEPIGQVISEYPAITRAIAYGVPNIVASDLVMVAMALKEGVEFDPADFHAWCRQRREAGELGEKWFPDFVRVVAGFEHTASNKIQVRSLQQAHFDPARLPPSRVYWRQRSDDRFHPLSVADYELLRTRYAEQERLHLLDA